jgi:hypothetical protein
VEPLVELEVPEELELPVGFPEVEELEELEEQLEELEELEELEHAAGFSSRNGTARTFFIRAAESSVNADSRSSSSLSSWESC